MKFRKLLTRRWILALPIFLSLSIVGCIEVEDDTKSKVIPTPSPKARHSAPLRFGKVEFKEDFLFIQNQFMTVNEYLNSYDEELGQSFSSPQKLSLHIEELILHPQAKFISYGQTLELHIDKLVSHQGKVVTHIEGLKAFPGDRGLSGGHIVFDVGYAQGQLEIVLRGQDGDLGGSSGALTAEFISAEQFSYSILRKPGKNLGPNLGQNLGNNLEAQGYGAKDPVCIINQGSTKCEP